MGGRNDMKAPIGKLGSYSLHRNGPRRRRRRDSRFLDAEFWPNEPKQPPRIPSNPRERKLSARSGRTNPSGASSVRRFWQTNRAVRNMRAILAKRTQRVRTVRLILAERTQGGANSARDLGQTNPTAYGVVPFWPTNPGNRRDITFWLNEPKGVPNSCAILAKRTRGIAPGEVVFILLSYRPERPIHHDLDLATPLSAGAHRHPADPGTTPMSYAAPVADMAFALKHSAGFGTALGEGLFGDLSEDVVEAVLAEAGKFATDIIAPLNAVGDRHGTPFKDGAVTMPPGWKEAYRAWSQAGWNALAAPAQWGGQELPQAVNAACIEMWNSAAMAFGLGPVLTMAGIDALAAHGSDALKRAYLGKLVSGEWMGTMQLTEPQAGSDVGALRTRAERAADGSYRITGTKIFITYGDHDMTDNIVHFVLARLPDAPAGTKGISLFLIPKFLVNADGSLGQRNDIYASGIEHKLGMHAAPTCTMTMGDKGGAVGYLIGEENRGMLCMFTMMNQARLGVGLEGVGIADRAYQQALAFAQERRQGRAIGKANEKASDK